MKKFLVYFTFVALSFMSLLPHLANASQSAATNPLPRLSLTNNEAKDNRFFKKLLVTNNPQMIEKNKIMYLIDRMRKSPYSFERNGEVHPSAKAANHLMMKYAYVKNRVKTVEQFIDHLASKSSTTGKQYHVIVSQEEKYPAGEILYNELGFLEEALKSQLS